jgi:hypothetical protein
VIATTSVLVLAWGDLSAGTVAVFTGPNLSREIILESAHIILGSDTVMLNGCLLHRGDDYIIESNPPRLKLSNYQPGPSDTLRIIYTPWPSWLTVTWGRPTPEPINNLPVVPQPSRLADKSESPLASGLQVNGAKSFRVNSGSNGGSSFGQSLDLTLSGELSPGVELTGAVSDRGYDPVYGVANSRLDEFDRLFLRLKAAHLLAQVGDITLSDFSSGMRKREVSGGAVRMTYPTFSAQAAVARPRGRFESVRLSGSDGFQGPYQPGNGITAIVPGSETVWLDGRPMERGANKDYVVDYPTGRITFTAQNPIDSRRRIEIDYEPLVTQYRQELLVGGSGVSSRDSSRQLSFVLSREGDDIGQPLVSLTPDDIAALEHSTDTVAVRSGVWPDSVGSYRLLADSLPDTVWQYMGAKSGNYTVRFSYVGASKGAYRFLGGEQYSFVGAGKGDYLPVILLNAARRTETARMAGLVKSATLGSLESDVRFSRVDRNLWSGGAQSNGAYYQIIGSKDWLWHGARNQIQARRQVQEADFVSSQRLDDPDLRRQFLLPAMMPFDRTRIRHDVTTTLSPVGGVMLTPFVSRLEFTDRFRADVVGFGCEVRPYQHLSVTSAWREVSSKYQLSPLNGRGDVRTISLDGVYTGRKYTIRSEAEYDRRWNAYSSAPAGTKFVRVAGEISRNRNTVRYEFYREDSLQSGWKRNLTRHRLNAGVERTLGNLHVDGLITSQWSKQPDRSDHALLGRANLAFDRSRRKLYLSAGYTISEEQRNARGFTYLQVDNGRGNYRLDNGRYIPDPFGSYIRIEELLSDQQRVRRGEKSFRFAKESRHLVVRANSVINEELLPTGKRPVWWLVPFVSDESQPYLFYERRYDLDARLVSLGSVHLFNITAADNREDRLIADQSRIRSERRVRLVLREPAKTWSLEQGVERFESKRDLLYGDAGQSRGWRGSVGARRTLARGEIVSDLSYRQADGANGERSRLLLLHSGWRLSLMARGELRLDGEAYRQSVTGVSGMPSTVLTDNHEGSRGFNWIGSVNFGLSGATKLSITLNGRYADSRPGQLFARSEIVAEF